ncbi:unnamed protein product [Cylindrotheca closterium]|nr:unnamed protein product [Cylindrotheca closterium]
MFSKAERLFAYADKDDIKTRALALRDELTRLRKADEEDIWFTSPIHLEHRSWDNKLLAYDFSFGTTKWNNNLVLVSQAMCVEIMVKPADGDKAKDAHTYSIFDDDDDKEND